jgi:hypothetical protein
MSTLAPSTADAERQRELLRARDQVRLIAIDHEGFSLLDQENGTYGYTSSPIGDEAPLYATPIFQCFECHKLPDGSTHVVGFVTPEECEHIEIGREGREVKLYPEPFGPATSAVSLALDRIGHKRPPSREDGNFVLLKVNPIM